MIDGPRRVRLAPDARAGFQVVDAAVRRRRLGVDDAGARGPLGLGRSLLPEILGERVVPVHAVHEPHARVVYFDRELADELGMDAEVDEAALRDALSWRIWPQGSPLPTDRRVLDVCCDRYGGVGLDKSRGAGRAIILPWGNLVAHGVGRTPLATPVDTRYGPNMGYTPMVLAWSRMVRAWVYDETFCLRSNRILAILDWDESVEVELDGNPHFLERRGVFVRAGLQFRPAHALDGEAGGGPWSRAVFLGGAEVAGVLVRGADGTPDWRATLHTAARRHAELQAEAQRYRILHGALSTSNMGVDGAMLDVEASTSQPGTAPIQSMDFQKKFGFVSMMDQFGFEQLARAHELQVAYDAVRSHAADLPPVDVLTLLAPEFERALEEELIAALGLKLALAVELRQACPELARELREAVVLAMRLLRPGSRIMLPVPRGVSAVRVMDLFLRLPQRWLAGEPRLDAAVADALALDVTGLEEGYAHHLRHRVRAIAPRLARALEGLLTEARARAVPRFYVSDASFAALVVARSTFAARTTPGIERDLLERRLRRATDLYDRDLRVEPLEEVAEGAKWASLRSVERVLRQGTHSLEGDVLITQCRRVRGGEVRLRAPLDGAVELELLSTEAEADWVADVCVVGHGRMLSARLSPDGASGTVRYRWALPEDAAGEVLVALRRADDDDDTLRATMGPGVVVVPDLLERAALRAALEAHR